MAFWRVGRIACGASRGEEGGSSGELLSRPLVRFPHRMPGALSDLLYALGLTAFVSLSGVMMPGPVFAAAVAKGYEDRLAGVWIALGHGVVEFPLMAILILGFGRVVGVPLVTVVVGIAGGTVLLYMGGTMILRQRGDVEQKPMPQHPLVLGIVTTASNPYFLIWWATIGLALIFLMYPFAIAGLVAFALVHWSCDLGWNGLVSATVHRTKRFWGERLRRSLFIVVGAFLLALGAWFAYTAVIEMGFAAVE